MQENRRSGLDRRNQNNTKNETKRTSEERRELLRGFNEIVKQYSKLPIFKGLSTEQLTTMLRICSKKKYSSKQYIYRIGSESDSMSVLLRGTVNIVSDNEDEKNIISPPGLVGELGLFTGDRRCASVVAETDCTLLNINNIEFLTIIDRNLGLTKSILLNVIKDLSQKIRKDNDKINQLHNKIHMLELL
ncbi:MAG: cyclic nucleotide-binding domain-containing protein [Candidatus Latescibacteria bacterium]|nr:cyclic nucleotide-binding domain-containing protein [Candidatus Latescibacterota bacterium]